MLGLIKIKASIILQEHVSSMLSRRFNRRFKEIKPGQAGDLEGRCSHAAKGERRLTLQREGKGNRGKRWASVRPEKQGRESGPGQGWSVPECKSEQTEDGLRRA